MTINKSSISRLTEFENRQTMMRRKNEEKKREHTKKCSSSEALDEITVSYCTKSTIVTFDEYIHQKRRASFHTTSACVRERERERSRCTMKRFPRTAHAHRHRITQFYKQYRASNER